MKPLDLLLFSLAVGLTLLNAIVLKSDYPRDFTSAAPADPLAPAAPKSRLFRAIVLHDLDRPHPAKEFPFHFVIGDGAAFPDGRVVPTERWKKQEGDRIEIALAPGHTGAQERALFDLIARLRRDYGIAAGDVGAHRELDPSAKCPMGMSGDDLRRRLR
ncbi:MAG: N-acetylmuramoyl-L-alanine amidase [Planctomycetes bacterium]|nr:N-acetylmuramoyl-L-alanine amidase [Planctomycetota bacterium]